MRTTTRIAMLSALHSPRRCRFRRGRRRQDSSVLTPAEGARARPSRGPRPWQGQARRRRGAPAPRPRATPACPALRGGRPSRAMALAATLRPALPPTAYPDGASAKSPPARPSSTGARPPTLVKKYGYATELAREDPARDAALPHRPGRCRLFRRPRGRGLRRGGRRATSTPPSCDRASRRPRSTRASSPSPPISRPRPIPRAIETSPPHREEEPRLGRGQARLPHRTACLDGARGRSTSRPTTPCSPSSPRWTNRASTICASRLGQGQGLQPEPRAVRARRSGRPSCRWRIAGRPTCRPSPPACRQGPRLREPFEPSTHPGSVSLTAIDEPRSLEH